MNEKGMETYGLLYQFYLQMYKCFIMGVKRHSADLLAHICFLGETPSPPGKANRVAWTSPQKGFMLSSTYKRDIQHRQQQMAYYRTVSLGWCLPILLNRPGMACSGSHLQERTIWWGLGGKPFLPWYLGTSSLQRSDLPCACWDPDSMSEPISLLYGAWDVVIC